MNIERAFHLAENDVRSVRTVFAAGLEHGIVLLELSGNTFPLFNQRKCRAEIDRAYGVVRSQTDSPLLGTGPLLAFAEGIDQVESQLRNDCRAGLMLDYAVFAVIIYIIGIVAEPSAGYTCFCFKTQMTAEPPRVTQAQACTEEIALHPLVTGIPVHTERETYVTCVIVGIEQISGQEETCIDCIGVITCLRCYDQIAPTAGSLLVGIIVDEAVPGFEAHVSAQSPMTVHRNFEAEVRSAGSIIEEVVSNRPRLRRFLLRLRIQVGMHLYGNCVDSAQIEISRILRRSHKARNSQEY